MMKIIIAAPNQRETAYRIVQDTIAAVYPRYYPSGVVKFFLDYHSEEAIRQAIAENRLYLLETEEGFVGTGSIEEDHIGRLYVLPGFQGRGYGTRLMDYLEPLVFQSFPQVLVEAAFPAFSLYEKRGYRSTGFHRYKTENGDVLCYHVMALQKK